MAQPVPGTLAAIVEALRGQGHVVVRDLFPRALVEELADECRASAATGQLRPAAVGPSGGTRHLPALRGDAIRWLEHGGGDSAVDRFLDACEALRGALNQALLLGMESLEAHFALYPPGAGYARHRDRFRADDARVLSLSCYLNAGWDPADGGALRLYLPEGVLDVPPLLGTSVLFLSADIEHEVLPARRPRASVAGWFRRRPVGNALP